MPNTTPPMSPLYVPGEVFALLSPLQELEPGLYLLHSLTEGWAVMRWIIDDEASEQLLVTNQQCMLPLSLMDFFMPVGLRLTPAA